MKAVVKVYNCYQQCSIISERPFETVTPDINILIKSCIMAELANVSVVHPRIKSGHRQEIFSYSVCVTFEFNL